MVFFDRNDVEKVLTFRYFTYAHFGLAASRPVNRTPRIGSQLNSRENDAPHTAAPDVKPLPQGYLWRVIVMITLLLSASMCFLFVNSILGSVLMLSGLAFGKFSSLHDLENDVIVSNTTESTAESLPKNTRQ